MFNQIPQISPEEAKTKASNGHFMIIDVREDREVNYTSLSRVSVPFTHRLIPTRTGTALRRS